MVSIDNVPQWLSGIGTILAVIVALFQKSIHNILNKPKINISCKNVKQCMVEQNLEQNDSDSRGIIVRVKIENTGNYTADNAALFVDSFLQKRNSDGEYVKKEFPPKQMHDFLQDKPNIIAPANITVSTVKNAPL